MYDSIEVRVIIDILNEVEVDQDYLDLIHWLHTRQQGEICMKEKFDIERSAKWMLVFIIISKSHFNKYPPVSPYGSWRTLYVTLRPRLIFSK